MENISFEQLSANLLYKIMQLRIDIFVVEQNCPYRELDDKDKLDDTLHLISLNEQGKLVAYARLLPPNASFSEASIGRVLVIKQMRNKGIARILLNKGMGIIQQKWPNSNIQLGAQQHLQKFYQSLGFKVNSDIYLEDNIPHINMIYRNENKNN